MGDIDTDARAQLGNVLSVLPQKLHKIEFASSYDFATGIPVVKNMLSIDSQGSAWISEDNPNYTGLVDGSPNAPLFSWNPLGGGGGTAAGGTSSAGITLSGVGDGVGSGVGVVDSTYLNVETDPNGLEFLNELGQRPTIRLSDQISQSSNELVIMWSIPEGFRKGVVPFPSSFNVPPSTTPTIFTQLIASGTPAPSYSTIISDVTSSGFTLELSAQTDEPNNLMNILVKTNEPIEMVAIPELPVGWDWYIIQTDADLMNLYQLNQLLENTIYYTMDTNRMYILSSDTGQLVYYQGSPV